MRGRSAGEGRLGTWVKPNLSFRWSGKSARRGEAARVSGGTRNRLGRTTALTASRPFLPRAWYLTLIFPGRRFRRHRARGGVDPRPDDLRSAPGGDFERDRSGTGRRPRGCSRKRWHSAHLVEDPISEKGVLCRGFRSGCRLPQTYVVSPRGEGYWHFGALLLPLAALGSQTRR